MSSRGPAYLGNDVVNPRAVIPLKQFRLVTVSVLDGAIRSISLVMLCQTTNAVLLSMSLCCRGER